MRATDAAGKPFRVLGVHDSGGVLATLGEPGFSSVPMSPAAMARCCPDFTDPATLGCLIALARDAAGGDFALSMGNGWWEMTQGLRKSWEGHDTASMIAALVDVVVGA